MVAFPRRQRLNLPIAPLAAALVGGVMALAFALMPSGILEDLVIDSGIASVVSAAEPPLGLTARAVLILIGGGGMAMIAWFALFLMFGTRSIVIQRSADSGAEEKAPVLRRADAHPDAPARRPVFANRDLGTPFLEVRAERPVHKRAEEPELKQSLPAKPDIEDAHFEPVPEAPVVAPIAAAPIAAAPMIADVAPTVAEPVDTVADERTIPADLDMPLAAFDPEAIPEEPADWAPSPISILRTPRQQVFDPGERFETFELTPMVRKSEAAPEPAHAPAQSPAQALAAARRERDPSASIHALLDRLERGVSRRESVPPPPSEPTPDEAIQQALVTLRRLATRA
jgi:hypothetical protein